MKVFVERPHRAIRLGLLLTLLVTVCSLTLGEGKDEPDGCWAPAIALVRSASPETLPSVREIGCTTWLPVLDPRPFHCMELGQEPWVEERDGHHILHGVIHNAQSWRVLVDCRSHRAYRLSGFSSSDFNDFVKSLSKKNLPSRDAEQMARFYLESTSSEAFQTVVPDVFWIQQAAGKYFRRFLGPRETLERVAKWMEALPSRALDEVREPFVRISSDEEYVVSVFVVRMSTEKAKEPRVGLREMRLAVGRDGTVRERGDLLLYDGLSPLAARE